MKKTFTTAKQEKMGWRDYLKEYWFLGIVTIIALYLVTQVIAMVVYVFLPESPSDTPPYFPHKINLPDGSTKQDPG
jgi:hypothetical protein